MITDSKGVYPSEWEKTPLGIIRLHRPLVQGRDDSNFLPFQFLTRRTGRDEAKMPSECIGKAVKKSQLFQLFPIKTILVPGLLRAPGQEYFRVGYSILVLWWYGSSLSQPSLAGKCFKSLLCLADSEMQGNLGAVVFRAIPGNGRHCLENYGKRPCTCYLLDNPARMISGRGWGWKAEKKKSESF